MVDDDEHVLNVIDTILSLEGYDVSRSFDAEEALAILAERDVQVLISDHLILGRVGLELLDQVRHWYPAVIRILLTGYSSAELPQHLLNRARVSALLQKPFTRQALLDTVRQALESAPLTTV